MKSKRSILYRAGGFLLVLTVLLVSCGRSNKPETGPSAEIELPYASLNPAGKRVAFGSAGSEEHALSCKFSPDGKFLAVLGRFHLVIWDVEREKILQSVAFPDRLLGTYSGLLWAKDSRSLFICVTSSKVRPNSDRILQAELSPDGKVHLRDFFIFREKKKRRPVIPNALAFGPAGTTLLVTLSGRNQVVEIDLAARKELRRLAVGKFPYGILVADGKAFVTDWGGRVPGPRDPTAGAGWNSVKGNERIVANPVTGGAASGTVTVIDLQSWKIRSEISVGLHPTEMALDAAGKLLFVANGNSDDVSVVSVDSLRELGRISVYLSGELVGDSSPAGLAVSPDGKTLFVAAGMLNAVAVVPLAGARSGQRPWSRIKVEGLIPTGAYPGGVDILPRKRLLAVANIEGLFARATTRDTTSSAFRLFYGPLAGKKSTAGAYNAHRQLGYFSLIPVPGKRRLEKLTKEVLAYRRYRDALENLKKTLAPPRANARPVPVPERLGEPSVFKHVLYIIKENRTYDQILGDLAEGDGDSSLTVFGEKVTPNHHKLAREFVLLDRYFVDGKCSAEGHPWSAAGYVTDWVERHVRGWFRGYYHVMLDAMVTPRGGYIWDSVLQAGLSFRNYGEALDCTPGRPDLRWEDYYRAYLSGAPIPPFRNEGTIEAAVTNASPVYPGYDHHKIPDALRARAFIRELKEFERTGNMPRFMIMILPADHTAGVRPGYPTPRAMVADNDLALGRIIEALSRSRFWKETVVFVTEDDSQSGWDHVSAYRTVGFVLSPYSRLRKTVHSHYDQLSMLHTIQQILGLKPLNLLVLSAPLMRDCFGDTPDLRPYSALKNRIPLDEMNPAKEALSGKARYWARVAETRLSLDLDDEANDDILNRMIWYSTRGYNTAYPEILVEEPEDGR